jgi:hypothetical protein
MTLPSIIPMSEKNAIASLGYWLQQNVVQPGEQFVNQTYEQVEAPFPVFAYIQRPLPDMAILAFGDYLGKGSLGDDQYGGFFQFMVEFNLVAALTDTVRNSQQYVHLMRERLRYGLFYAGQIDDATNTPVMPNIQLLDFDTNPSSPTATGGYLWWPSEESNTWMESPLLADSADPQKKRIQVTCRFKYSAFRP